MLCACSRTHLDIKKLIVVLCTSVCDKDNPSVTELGYQNITPSANRRFKLVRSQGMFVYKMKVW